MEIQDLPYVLVNYHAPNDEQGQLCTLNEISDKLKTLSVDEDTRLIWGGDWNCILDKSLDAMGGSPSLKKESVKLIQNLMNDFDLVDVWRLRNLTYKKFSWRRTKPVTMRRLDFFLVSDKMELDISGCGFYAPVQSDHSPIFIKISPLQETARGPGYWKFNSSLVNDPTFVEKTKEIINEVAMNITNQFEDYRIGWEFLKYKVRQFSQVYSKRKTCECREKRVNLEKKIEELESNLSENSAPEEIFEYKNAKAQLDDLYNYITEGAILRSKVRWYEEDEKSTKYFLNLEKSNRNKTSIKKLIKPDSEIEITGFNEIQKEIKSFYQSLYSRKSLKTEKQCLDYLKDINTPKITTQQKMVCEEKLTVKECFDTLLTMSNGKSPGNDGLTKEFYVCFWEDLGSLLVDTLKYAFQYGELSTSQRQAVITLIEKKGQDKRLIKNWKPISLINVDTKIASKSLAIRIKEFLPQLVDCDQTAYVKGRNQ